CARAADGMAECYGAPQGVHPVVGDAQLLQHRQRLRGEGLVELDDLQVVETPAGAVESLVHRGYRADAHAAWFHTRCGGGDNPRDRMQVEALDRILSGQQTGGGAIVE